MNDAETDVTASERGDMTATHIRLICWVPKHVQAISPEQLRQIRIAPVCTAMVGESICGEAIWAVDHEGEPRRYVGRPPHSNWEQWADCIPRADEGGS